MMIAILACFNLSAADASAQSYPVKPIRIVFGFAPGGAGDVSARMLAQKVSESLGQPVIVENRTGAGGAIADEFVARSAPDGYTLLYAAGAFATLPALRSKLPYDAERDFAPAAVSKDVVARLNATIVKAVNTTDLKDSFVKQGYEVQTGTPEEFAAFIRRELAQNAKLVKFAGVKTE